MPEFKRSAAVFAADNIVVLVFAVICLLGFSVAGLSFPFFLNDIISRLGRNTFIVLSLIIPVVAGMGLNFAIVLGAMGGQFGMIAVTHWGIGGLGGIALSMALALPLNILFGYLTGLLLNRARGREMIAGLILGFFALGLYQLVLLVFVGTIIPMTNPEMVLSTGVGLRTSIDIGPLKYGVDNVLRIPVPWFAVAAGAALAVWGILRAIWGNPGRKEGRKFPWMPVLAGVVIAVWGAAVMTSESMVNNLRVPAFTFLLIALLCLFTAFIQRTKLGQDLRTVGQDQHIALVSGINVNRMRVIAIIISMVLAGWGQIIFLQNLGIFSTYGAHEQVGLFAVAALLIGGASVRKAHIGHAIMGTLLFHTMFIISPLAAQNLFGNAQVGEYFRVFVTYGIIGIALAMYAWQKTQSDKRALSRLWAVQQQTQPPQPPQSSGGA